MASPTLSDEPWGNFSASDYEDAGAYCDACLVNENAGPRSGWTKDNCRLPVREPDGNLNRGALAAAAGALAGARGGVDISAAAKQAAAKSLVRAYRSVGLTAPAAVRELAGDTSGGMNDAIRRRAGYGS